MAVLDEFMIPDEAIEHITRQFVESKAREGVPVVIGISHQSVEKVLELFISWADQNGYLKDGILTMGGYKIG